MTVVTLALIVFLCGILCGLFARRAFELCKILLEKLHYIRLEISLGGDGDLDVPKQVARGEPGPITRKPSLRGSRPRAALKQGRAHGKAGKD